MRESLFLGIVMMVSALTSGCAYFLHGEKEEISIDSDPRGEEVVLAGKIIGKTPVNYIIQKVSSKDKLPEVAITKEGYQRHSFRLEHQFDNAAVVDFIFSTGLAGTTSLIADYSTGEMYEYSPKNYYIRLEQESKATSKINNEEE
ncbi:MAG: PEGA domain-containing protein [SAR324 cluster bacterium]|nr:PEGA domain-containing protein [SAR324 cluster bacterium]